MKFYKCHTPEGLVYARTQADAKALDPNFDPEGVDIATDQKSLTNFFNQLLQQGRRSVPEAVEEGEAAMEDLPPPPTPSPPKLKRPEVIERVYDQTGFEQFIWNIPDNEARRLDQLEAVIKERRDEIAGIKRERQKDEVPQGRKQWGKKA